MARYTDYHHEPHRIHAIRVGAVKTVCGRSPRGAMAVGTEDRFEAISRFTKQPLACLLCARILNKGAKP